MFDPVRICPPSTLMSCRLGNRTISIDGSFLANMPVMLNLVTDLGDSKRAANRPKDQMALPYLESLRDELSDR